LLSQQEERIENPDRLARFRFVRDSLSANPTLRNSFFESLKEEANRDREAWVIAGLSNIHHPLRAKESIDLISPALNMIEEIQQTNRDREAWVIAGLSNIHHPLRAEESIGLISPALNMIEEIQQTGDIFFPGRWLDSTLQGHNSTAAAEIVRRFLDTTPNLSAQMRLKVLQSADGVFRAAQVVNGWNND